MCDSKNRLTATYDAQNTKCKKCGIDHGTPRHHDHAGWLCPECYADARDIEHAAVGLQAYVSAEKLQKFQTMYDTLRNEKWGGDNA